MAKNEISLVMFDEGELEHMFNVLVLADGGQISDPQQLDLYRRTEQLKPSLRDRTTSILYKLQSGRPNEAKRVATKCSYPEDILSGLLAITITTEMQAYLTHLEDQIAELNARPIKPMLTNLQLIQAANRRQKR